MTYRDEGLEIFVTLSDTLMREKQEDEKRPHGVVGGWKGVARRTSHSCSKIKKKDRRGEKSPESLKLKNKINGSASGRASIYRTFGANFGRIWGERKGEPGGPQTSPSHILIGIHTLDT